MKHGGDWIESDNSAMCNRTSNSRTTLLIVCNVASSYTGNIGSSIAALAHAALERGWKVVILLPEEARGENSTTAFAGLDLVFAPFSPFGLAGCLKKNRKELSRDKRVLVHLNFVGSLETAIFKSYFDHIVFHHHMAPKPKSASIKGKFKETIQRSIYRGITLVGVSDPVACELAALYPRSICISVPNAIDFHRLGAPEPAPSKPHDSFLLGVFGNHFMRKGVDIAIEAVSIASSHGVPCKLEIYASEPNEISDMVETLVLNYKLPGDSVLLRHTREDVASIYNSLDVFMSPSRSEAFCTAVVEASYCAPQVIASLVPGQDSLRVIPGTIWFDIKGGALALAGAIEDAWEQVESGNLDAIKDAQRRYVLSHYALDEWVQRMLDVFDKALRG
ncbi:glycosyltransferase family 4 protein [Enorma massiliensis]|uniref:glycosyltransferase family 4 protein n=1 Tax=Enorma massiliensis TaxID=1472761 RepID=UPI003AEF6E4F